MEKGYFAAAWGDITKSPGWGSILLRLGLLCLIPVFGVVVAYGYLYSWARDIAWNVHRPMPAKIFGNEDGGLCKRGFFILVVVVVFSLVPSAFSSLTSMVAGGAFVSGGLLGSYAPIVMGFLLWLVSGAASLALALLAELFTWVGSMRVSLYGTLSSGFQLGKIWAMMRYDFIGLLRILGMNVLIGLVICFGAVAIAGFLVLLCSGLIFLLSNSSSTSLFAIALLIAVGIVFVAGVLFCFAFQLALTTRALGYWTRQFEVSQWNGQEDPMPFERKRTDTAYGPAENEQAGAASTAQQSKVGHQATYTGEVSAVPVPNAEPGAIAHSAPYSPADGSVVERAQGAEASCAPSSEESASIEDPGFSGQSENEKGEEPKLI